MEVYIDWEDDDSNAMHELGRFNDLVAWVKEFNRAWAGRMKYVLEAATDQPGTYLFYEMDPDAVEYQVGTIHKDGDDALAISEAVHNLVIGAFDRYQSEFGEE